VPRGGRVARRETTADTRFQSKLVGRLIGSVMRCGERATAEKAVYGAMDVLEEKGMSSINVLKTAVENVKPLLEVRARRVGGANYQVPIEVRPERRLALAIRWIMAAVDARGERSFSGRLAGELAEAASGTGGAMKKREEIHKMAESNRAFAHYRW